MLPASCIRVGNRKFYLLKNPTPWRRVSLATWRKPDNPTVYSTLAIDFSASKKFLEKMTGDCKITVTHLVAKAVALTLKKYPDLNGLIRWGRIYLRRTVDLFFQVAIDNQAQSAAEGEAPLALPMEGETRAPRDDKPDLSGVVVEQCEEKSLHEIAKTLQDKSRKVRSEGISDFTKTFSMLKLFPTFIQALMIKSAAFLIYNLGISAPRWGLPADPFGSAMITNVGMFGMPPGFAPLVPSSRVPLVVCIGEIRDKPWVENGAVVVRPILELAITFDHRFMDGLTASRMAHYFQEIIENPERYFE